MGLHDLELALFWIVAMRVLPQICHSKKTIFVNTLEENLYLNPVFKMSECSTDKLKFKYTMKNSGA